MLNFKNTSVFFIVLLTLISYLCYRHHLSFYWLIPLGFLYTTVLFYGSVNVGSGFYVQTVCNVRTSEKKIAISFDDGPLEKYTPEILNILRSYGVKACFFCIGNRVAKNPDLVRQIYKEGHLIGNHSYSHSFWFDLQSKKKVKKDIQQMKDIVQQEIGVKTNWFRPPYGVTNPNIAKAVKALDQIVIGWNVRSLDTIIKNEDILLQRLKQHIKPGAIFLFHDTQKITTAVLPQFLAFVKKNGYEIERPDKLLNLLPYA